MLVHGWDGARAARPPSLIFGTGGNLELVRLCVFFTAKSQKMESGRREEKATSEREWRAQAAQVTGGSGVTHSDETQTNLVRPAWMKPQLTIAYKHTRPAPWTMTSTCRV